MSGGVKRGAGIPVGVGTVINRGVEASGMSGCMEMGGAARSIEIYIYIFIHRAYSMKRAREKKRECENSKREKGSEKKVQTAV